VGWQQSKFKIYFHKQTRSGRKGKENWRRTKITDSTVAPRAILQ